MDRETIIKLAREAAAKQGHTPEGDPQKETVEFLGNFAKLVAEHRQKWWEEQVKVEIHEAVLEEREACAKVCDAEVQSFTAIGEHRPALAVGICAATIRARGTHD
jgi:hypothetical protein